MVTISIFHYKGFANKYRAFTRMATAHRHLKKSKGLRWYKLLGSGGGNGFSLMPDWGTYFLVGVWDSKEDFENFFSEDFIGKEFQKRSFEHLNLIVNPIKSKGSWGGINPFKENDLKDIESLGAVLTRARIRTGKQLQFWKAVPGASSHVGKYAKFAKGIGEYPFLEQATFSIWENFEVMENFAYKNKDHKEAVKNTRIKDWYSEELFARFEVLKIEGSYKKFSK